jgi:hypothetical protein
MLTIETINRLSDSEKHLLKSLIGKQIHSIYSDGVNLFTQRADYSFTGPLNITLLRFDGKYYIFKYAYYENELGEEYFTTDLFTTEKPVQVNTSPDGSIQLPCASLDFSEAFTIERIAVYGLEYDFIIQNNTEPVAHWKILNDHPGTPIKSVISTEHILVFTATDGKEMAIYPSSALPWIVVSFETDLINKIKKAVDAYPFKNYKLKHTFH